MNQSNKKPKEDRPKAKQDNRKNTSVGFSETVKIMANTLPISNSEITKRKKNKK